MVTAPLSTPTLPHVRPTRPPAGRGARAGSRRAGWLRPPRWRLLAWPVQGAAQAKSPGSARTRELAERRGEAAPLAREGAAVAAALVDRRKPGRGVAGSLHQQLPWAPFTAFHRYWRALRVNPPPKAPLHAPHPPPVQQILAGHAHVGEADGAVVDAVEAHLATRARGGAPPVRASARACQCLGRPSRMAAAQPHPQQTTTPPAPPPPPPGAAGGGVPPPPPTL
jgi:hypothetical protein